MTHTRYTAGNIALLVLAILFSMIISLMFIMGWAGDATDFRTHCSNLFADTAFFAFPASLIALRWTAISCIALWSITIISTIFSLLAHSSEDLHICFLLAVLSAMVTGVLINSQDANARDRNR